METSESIKNEIPKKKSLEDLKPGDFIRLPQAPFGALVTEDDSFGDLNKGHVTKDFLISTIESMSPEMRKKVAALNPNWDVK